MPNPRSASKTLPGSKASAEIQMLAAQRDFHLANARVATILGDQEDLVLKARRRVEAQTLAQDSFHRVYVFDHNVDDDSVKDCVKQLTTWSRTDPQCDIEIQINTLGGEIFSGFALVDFIRTIRQNGHKVTIVVYGHAASMGAVILQAADHRVMGENAFLLIHEGSMFSGGDYRQLEDDMKLYAKLHDRILSLLGERSSMSVANIKKSWKSRDWWLNADESKKAGFVDEVR